MTNDEIIKGLNAVKEECGKHLDESFAWICQPIDAAIEIFKTGPCEDAISRKDTCNAIIKRLGIKDETFLLEAERAIYQQILEMPSVTPQLCEDAISRQAAISLASDLKQDLPDDECLADMAMAHNEGVSEYQTQLSLLPHITPQPGTGRWIEYVEPDDAEPLLQWRCDKCGTIERRKTHYCPNCGDKKKVE